MEGGQAAAGDSATFGRLTAVRRRGTKRGMVKQGPLLAQQRVLSMLSVRLTCTTRHQSAGVLCAHPGTSISQPCARCFTVSPTRYALLRSNSTIEPRPTASSAAAAACDCVAAAEATPRCCGCCSGAELQGVKGAGRRQFQLGGACEAGLECSTMHAASRTPGCSPIIRTASCAPDKSGPCSSAATAPGLTWGAPPL